MKRISLLILPLFLLVCSCKKNDIITEEEPEPENPITYSKEFTKYKRQGVAPNTVGLQMIYKDTTGKRSVLFYGNFNQEGHPDLLSFIQIVRNDNDTIFNYHLDDTLGLSYISLTVKNQSEPIAELLKISKSPIGYSYLALYHRRWAGTGDSLIEQHYIDQTGGVVSVDRVAEIRTSLAADRSIYTSTGVEKPKLTTLSKNITLASGKIKPILAGFTQNGTGGMIPVYAYMSSALDLNGVLAILSRFDLSLSSTGPSIQFQLSNDFPIAVITESGGAFIANYQQITPNSIGSYVPPVLLMTSSLVPLNGNLDVVCQFRCPLENYENGRFYHSLNKENQVIDSVLFFFTLKDNSSYHTKHRQTKRNVTISADNVVSGEIVIHNVWPLIGFNTIEDIYKEFKAVYFYSGFRTLTSGWGPLSNVLHLKDEPDGSEKHIKFFTRVDNDYACASYAVEFMSNSHTSRWIRVYYRRKGFPDRLVAEVPPTNMNVFPPKVGETFIWCAQDMWFKIESTKFMN